MAHHPELPDLLDDAPLQVDGALIDHWVAHDTLFTARDVGAVSTGAIVRAFRWKTPDGVTLDYRRNVAHGDFHLQPHP